MRHPMMFMEEVSSYEMKLVRVEIPDEEILRDATKFVLTFLCFRCPRGGKNKIRYGTQQQLSATFGCGPKIGI